MEARGSSNEGGGQVDGGGQVSVHAHAHAPAGTGHRDRSSDHGQKSSVNQGKTQEPRTRLSRPRLSLSPRPRLSPRRSPETVSQTQSQSQPEKIGAHGSANQICGGEVFTEEDEEESGTTAGSDRFC